MTLSIVRATLVSLVCASVCTLTAATVGAQSSGQRVATLTFSGPVQVPGAMLPAGTYLFRQIAGPVDGHRLVQVSAVEPTRLVAQFRTKPSRRAAAGGDVTFRPTLNGTSPAIATWYFNKGMEGSEFLYSASELRALATAPPRPVNLK